VKTLIEIALSAWCMIGLILAVLASLAFMLWVGEKLIDFILIRLQLKREFLAFAYQRIRSRQQTQDTTR